MLRNLKRHNVNTFLKEQKEYTQDQINKIRNSVENKTFLDSIAELDWKLLAKKNEYTSRNNISSFFSENFRKLRMNQSQKLLIIN